MDHSSVSLSQDNKTFGSFYIGPTEFAMDVTYLQEVCTAPSHLTPMPMSPPYLAGIYNLRGMIVPVIKLSILLALPEKNPSETDSKLIAIVDYQGAKIGFLLDRTGEVLRPRKDATVNFAYAGVSSKSLIRQALRLENGTRLAQILDPTALATVENIPHVQALSKEMKKSVAAQKGQRKQCITFHVSKHTYAFEMTGILEILQYRELGASELKSNLCFGVVEVRGLTIPVIDFHSVLGNQRSHRDILNDSKIIILQTNSGQIGVIVDAIDSILPYRSNEVIPVPVITKRNNGIFEGCISDGKKNEVLLLNHNKLTDEAEIEYLAKGYRTLINNQYTAVKEKDYTESEKRKTFISFTVGTTFALPILCIKSIVEAEGKILAIPGFSEIIKGVFNLRGDLIPVFDPRVCYKLEEMQPSNTEKIIIIKSQSLLYGILVDSVDSILVLSENNQTAIPTILLRKFEESMGKDLLKAVEVDNNQKVTLIVLDHEMVANRICSKIPGQSNVNIPTTIIETDCDLHSHQTLPEPSIDDEAEEVLYQDSLVDIE